MLTIKNDEKKKTTKIKSHLPNWMSVELQQQQMNKETKSY